MRASEIKVSILLKGFEKVNRSAKATGKTCKIEVPTSWSGCDVAVIRLSDRRI